MSRSTKLLLKVKCHGNSSSETMTQAVSRLPLAAEVRVLSQVFPCGIYGRHSFPASVILTVLHALFFQLLPKQKKKKMTAPLNNTLKSSELILTECSETWCNRPSYGCLLGCVIYQMDE
jgi:hypothetical protein